MTKYILAAFAVSAALFSVSPANATLSDEHISWCQKTHPSYNVATNKYNSSRSTMKTCSSPYDDSDVVSVTNQTYDDKLNSDEKHQEWCQRTHPSYSVATNMYHSGRSIRKQCSSPYN